MEDAKVAVTKKSPQNALALLNTDFKHSLLAGVHDNELCSFIGEDCFRETHEAISRGDV
jgi:hypothetical protein